jgi:hypothetical protein
MCRSSTGSLSDYFAHTQASWLNSSFEVNYVADVGGDFIPDNDQVNKSVGKMLPSYRSTTDFYTGFLT